MSLTSSQFTRLLKRAAKAAKEQKLLNNQLTQAFEDRYGCTYSDVDADELIDCLDYGHGGSFKASEVDEIMSRCGATQPAPSQKGSQP